MLRNFLKRNAKQKKTKVLFSISTNLFKGKTITFLTQFLKVACETPKLNFYHFEDMKYLHLVRGFICDYFFYKMNFIIRE